MNLSFSLVVVGILWGPFKGDCNDAFERLYMDLVPIWLQWCWSAVDRNPMPTQKNKWRRVPTGQGWMGLEGLKMVDSTHRVKDY